MSCRRPHACDNTDAPLVQLLMVPPCRWAVKIDAWNPEQEEWSYLLDLVSSEVQAEVHRYKFPADQRRALVSRLLQRRCSAEVCSLSFSEIDIQRTKGAKPFCASPCNRTVAPNFNFNVSHEVSQLMLTSCNLLLALLQAAARCCRETMLYWLQSQCVSVG